MPGFLLGPEPLGFSASVVSYDGMGCRENVSAGAVILFEFYDFSLRKILFKVEYVPYIGSSPLIYALVVVSDNAQVLMRLGHQFHYLILNMIRILILVYHYI